jgi:hypothetical protein
MADWAKFVTAAEKGLGWEDGTFLRAYDEYREASIDESIAMGTLASSLVKLAAEFPVMMFTHGELLKMLESKVPEEERGRRRPKDPTQLSKHIERIRDYLAQVGVDVSDSSKNNDGNRVRFITYRAPDGKQSRVRYPSPAPTTTSASSEAV